jgi:hypothetical protein
MGAGCSIKVDTAGVVVFKELANVSAGSGFRGAKVLLNGGTIGMNDGTGAVGSVVPVSVLKRGVLSVAVVSTLIVSPGLLSLGITRIGILCR